MINRPFPIYPDDADYTTNAPSYYDDLARKQKLVQLLAEKIWEYDEELAKRFEEWDQNLEDFPEDVKNLLIQWLDNGTLGQIIQDEFIKITFKESITVNIPSDFPDLQSAVDFYSQKTKVQGKQIILNIEKDHLLTKGLEVRHGDYSYFEIVSENEITYLNPYFEGVQERENDRQEYGFVDLNGSLIAGLNSQMPVLNCVIDMENKHGTGYFMYNSKGLVKKFAGVINAGLNGIYAMASHIDARMTDFSGAMNEGFRAQHGSVFDLMGSNFDNCCKNGTGEASIYISKGSYGGARELTAQNSGTNGIKIRRSVVDIERSIFNGAQGLGGSFPSGSGIIGEGKATISGTGAEASNCSRFGVYMTQFSEISGGIFAKNNGVRDLNVEHYSVIMGGITTHSDDTGLQPDVRDTNLSFINMPTGKGLITDMKQPDILEYIPYVDGHMLKFIDGTIIVVKTIKTVELPLLGVGEVSALLTPIPTPPQVVTTLSRDLKVWGRENLNGGGGVIGVDMYGRNMGDGDYFRVKNTGISLNTTDVDKSIQSIQFNEVIIGRWK